MSDDKLDKMFVEAAENPEVEFNPSNWDKMSALLDNATPAGTGGGSSVVGWKGIASFITLAIVGSVFYHIQRGDVSIKPAEQSAAVQSTDLAPDLAIVDEDNTSVATNSTTVEDASQPLAERETIDEKVQNEASNKDSSSTKTEFAVAGQGPLNSQFAQDQTKVDNKPQADKLSPTSAQVMNGSRSNAVAEPQIQSDNSRQGISGEEKSEILQENANDQTAVNPRSSKVLVPVQEVNSPENNRPTVHDGLPSTLETVTEQKEAEKVTTSSVTESKEMNVSEQKLSSNDPSDKAINTINNQVSPAQSPTSPAESLNREEEVLANEELSEDVNAAQEINDEENVRAVFPRGFSIKVGVSPDFSSVSFRPSSGMGVNFGMLGEYRFANRWSVSAGLITSKKTYSGSDVEYEASNSQVYVADEMEGRCTVLDIPINISYSFGNPARTSYFVTTGLSSYMMMTENYTWSYDNGLKFDVTASRENNDWFKQLNISIGIQRRLSDHFYVQFEPFIKAPLAGVGEGKVSLTSLGAFINVRYSFAK